MTETIRPAFPDRELPEISYGIPYAAACANALERYSTARAYLLCSASLAKNTRCLEDLQQAIGQDAIVGIRRGLRPHTLLSEVLEVIREARQAQADVLITLGAGSLTDAAKIVSFALANDIDDLEGLLQLTTDSPDRRESILPSEIPIISIPTSLSGGEYSNFAGGTHDTTHRKHSFGKPCAGPRLVILDAALSVHTPQSIWLSTGVRAIDHCVETICSLQADAESESDGKKGLEMLIPNLLKTKKNPEDTEARHLTQLAVIAAMSACSRGVPLGASHGIGHQLGPLNVGHGETSCILLPAVCKYNASKKANLLQQDIVSQLLWTLAPAREVFEANNLSKGSADLGDLLNALFKALGMPRTLSHFSIGEDKLEGLAVNSLYDRWVKTLDTLLLIVTRLSTPIDRNPAQLDKEGVLEILHAVL